METLKTLRRWSGVIKRRLLRFCEIKTGIVLSRPLGGASGTATDAVDDFPQFQKTVAYRRGMPWTEKEFIRRLGGGNALYELFVEGQSVCYGWVAEPGTRVGVVHDLHLVVPARGVYVWDCGTEPAFRGKGYFRALLHQINHGPYPTANLALVAVDTGNRPSRRALDSAGFRPVFTYLSARFMRRTAINAALRNGKIRAAQPQFDQLGGLAENA